MRTFDEILSAAALLSPMDLSRLRPEIERLDKMANAIVLETSKGITFRLCRLTDGEYVEALDRSLAIQDDHRFYLSRPAEIARPRSCIVFAAISARHHRDRT